jgi:hypothetical protein
VNYKDGRFCEAHLNLRGVCGIITCGLAVRHTGALTCATPAHIQWERQYTARFSRLTFPGIRRVIRRQQGLADDADFFVHVLMMIYAEKVEKQVFQKSLGLSDDFWVEAVGITAVCRTNDTRQIFYK